MNRVLIVLLTLLLAMQTMAQMPFRVMEYNVENLFDTQDDEGSQDEDFLPQGKCQWDTIVLRKRGEPFGAKTSSETKKSFH